MAPTAINTPNLDALLLTRAGDSMLDRNYVIKAVERIKDVDEREAVVGLASRVITINMSGEDRVEVIKAFQKMDANQRESVVGLVPRLFATVINFSERVFVINAVARIEDVDERKAVVDYASRFFVDRMSGLCRVRIINTIANITVEEREAVVDFTSRFIIVNRGRGEYRCDLIDAVKRIAADEREAVVGLASRLITRDMGEGCRARVIDAIGRGIIADERHRRVERAAEQITGDFLHGREEQGRFYHLLDGRQERERFDRLMVLLETPLDEAFPPLRGGMAAVAAANRIVRGVNVHHNDRDAKTRRALELLREATGVMDAVAIKNAVSEFEEYLKAYPNETIRDRAQRALNGEMQSSDFPALLHDSTFTVSGLSISGEEVIARLWRFIHQYKDPHQQDQIREQENMRQSLVNGLSDGIDWRGHRVCNPGKVQRLIVSVLQGRLEGVNVDGVDLDTPAISLAVAQRTFFNVPRNRELYTPYDEHLASLSELRDERRRKLENMTDTERALAVQPAREAVYLREEEDPLLGSLREAARQLREAAIQFCEENPRVNREEFLGDLFQNMIE